MFACWGRNDDGAAYIFSIYNPYLPNGVRNDAYDQDMLTATVWGGTPPYVFNLVSGSLPPGLTMSASGQLSGTPTTAGLYNFTVSVTDGMPFRVSAEYTLEIVEPPLIVEDSLPNGRVGKGYAQTLTVNGGTLPFTFSLVDGSLPPGIMLSSDGVISGTPTLPGSYTFTVQVLDYWNFSDNQEYTLQINYGFFLPLIIH